MKRLAFFVLAVVVLGSAGSSAKNIDLVTLPARDSVQLTIYNSEDITLVKETRYITLKKGSNALQFSWANTLIDPTSVEFRALEHKDEIELLDTVFPGQKPQHLIWNIESEYEGQVKVEVSYFTSGLTWTMDYVCVTDPEEEKMLFTGYVRVWNNSGEDYENAEVRLIVGKINLVEKIADLAQRQGIPMPAPVSEDYKQLKRKAAAKSFEEAEMVMMAPAAPMETGPKKIVKEGVSEYFMFSIPGSESIKNGWSKRMRAVKAENVKFDIVYRMRAHQYGERPQRFFIWKNDEEHKLGDSPLPDGRVRIFRENQNQGLSFLGEQNVNYVPILADIEINLGPDDLVVYETKKMKSRRFNFHFYVSNNKEYVDGWDEEQQWTDQVRNYHAKPIAFELRRVWSGDVDYESDEKTELFDFQTTEVKLTVEGRGSKDYSFKLVFHMGENKKQDRIRIK